MAWLAVNEDGKELVFEAPPIRRRGNPIIGTQGVWILRSFASQVVGLPSGTIEKIIGRSINWFDEPVNI